MLSAIVCMDNFGGIGKNGDLLYRIPDDLKKILKRLQWDILLSWEERHGTVLVTSHLKVGTILSFTTTLNYAVRANQYQ